MAQYARWEEEGWEVWSVLFLIPNTDNQKPNPQFLAQSPGESQKRVIALYPSHPPVSQMLDWAQVSPAAVVGSPEGLP
jgi:hypothetical protein